MVNDGLNDGASDVTTFAPARVMSSAIPKLIPGLIFAAPLFALSPSRLSHMTGESLAVVALCATISVLFIGRAISLIAASFVKGCYVRAGREGVAIRLPSYGMFGYNKIAEHHLAWQDIEKLTPYKMRVNGIATTEELRIQLRGGKRIAVPRRYFKATSVELQSKLIAASRAQS